MEWVRAVADLLDEFSDWVVIRGSPWWWTCGQVEEHVDRLARLVWLASVRRPTWSLPRPMLALAAYITYIAPDTKWVNDAHGQRWPLWTGDEVAAQLGALGLMPAAFFGTLDDGVEVAIPPAAKRQRKKAAPARPTQRAEREAHSLAAFLGVTEIPPEAPPAPTTTGLPAWAVAPWPLFTGEESKVDPRRPVTAKQLEDTRGDLVAGMVTGAAPWYFAWFQGEERRCWPVPTMGLGLGRESGGEEC